MLPSKGFNAIDLASWTMHRSNKTLTYEELLQQANLLSLCLHLSTWIERNISLQANAKLLRAPDDAAQAVVLCDLSNSRWWSILYSNTPFAAVAGVPPEALIDNSFWKLFRPANNEAKVQLLIMIQDLQPSAQNMHRRLAAAKG